MAREILSIDYPRPEKLRMGRLRHS